MSSRALFALLVAVLAVAAAGPGTTVGSSHYAVSVSPSIDLPDRTETFQGSSYTVTELGRVDAGEAVDVDVEVGSGTSYEVLLYDADQQIEDQESGSGDGTESFPTASLEPGSYVVALDVDGVIEDIEPVVVSQYHVSVDAPSSATEGSTIDVSAELADADSGKTLDDVEVVVGDDDQTVRESLSEDSGDTYAGSVDVSSLSTGEYSLYVVARGTETIYGGQTELLGASDPRSFEVEAESSDDGGSGGSGGGGSGGGSGGGGGGDGGETTAETTTDTPAETTTSESPTTSDEPAGTTDDATRATTAEDASEPATTDDSVITPNDPTTEPATTSPGQPLGVLPVVLALLAVVVLARQRR